jgi:translation initiation factor IF-3
MAHQELGYRLLERISKDLEGIGFVEMRPEMLGRDMNMVMAPGSKPSAAVAPATTQVNPA